VSLRGAARRMASLALALALLVPILAIVTIQLILRE
jgi:hypothetical protein